MVYIILNQELKKTPDSILCGCFLQSYRQPSKNKEKAHRDRQSQGKIMGVNSFVKKNLGRHQLLPQYE